MANLRSPTEPVTWDQGRDRERGAGGDRKTIQGDDLAMIGEGVLNALFGQCRIKGYFHLSISLSAFGGLTWQILLESKSG